MQKLMQWIVVCISEIDRQLIHNVCWCPAQIFTKEALSTAVSCWEWILGARKDLELHVGVRVRVRVKIIMMMMTDDHR